MNKVELTKDTIIKRTIELLSVFDSVCERNKIQYFLAFGTLLGAVREGGFIPWDNDIDLFIFRGEAERLYSTFKETKQYGLRWAYYRAGKYLKHRIYFYDKTTMGEGWESIGIHLDIFIMDYVPNSFFKRIMKTLLYKMYDAKKLRLFDKSRRFFKQIILCIIRAAMCFFSVDFIEKRLWPYVNFGYTRLKTKEEDLTSKTTYNYIDPCPSLPANAKYLRTLGINRNYPLSAFKPVKLKYENNYFPAPAGYEKILTIDYGRDYMIPTPKAERNKVVGRVWQQI